MRFLGDMGVSWRVIEWLRAAGHDAVHLRNQGLTTATSSLRYAYPRPLGFNNTTY
jgi:predicted nuclease of predicted toxin-antitoxin system